MTFFGTAFGSVNTDQANYDGNDVYDKGRLGVYREKTMEVGQFPANAWGLHDTHGNVWERTGSVYDKDYGGGEQCCAKLNKGDSLVTRGGSFFCYPRYARCAFRSHFNPGYRSKASGFRVAVSLSFSE